MSLLSIPREVRDEIINIVISTPGPPPSTSQPTPGNRQQQRDNAYPASHYSSRTNVLYEPLPNRTSSIPLLLVNHQLHDETIAAIERLPASYIIDVMIHQERQLWPTWLLLPKLENRIDKIYTTFRIAGIPPPAEEGQRRVWTGFSRGCGGPPWIEWCLFDLWESLLKIGPTGNSKELRSVKLLELDVISPDSSYHVAPLNVDPGDLPAFRKTSGVDYVLNPLSIVAIIEHGLDILLDEKGYAEEYGGIFYEGLGMVRLLHDGRFQKEWDVARMFEEMEFSERYGRVPREERIAAFEMWKARIRKRRIQVGLLEPNAEDKVEDKVEEADEVYEVDVRPQSISDEVSEDVGESTNRPCEVDEAVEMVQATSRWKSALRKGKKLMSRDKKE